jgi:hypothetical protein
MIKMHGERVRVKNILRLTAEVIGNWRKFRNKEPHNLFSSPNFIQVINSRGMMDELAGRVACKGREEQTLQSYFFS